MTVLEMVLIGSAAGALVPLVLFGPRITGRRREVAGYDGDGKPPSERHRRRAKARAEAPQHEPVPEADRELVEVMHWMVVKARTDEHPMVWLARRKAVTRGPARWQRIAAARRRLARVVAADPLRAPLDVPLERPVATAGLVEPRPWDLESFTDCWTAAAIAALVAEARAGVR